MLDLTLNDLLFFTSCIQYTTKTSRNATATGFFPPRFQQEGTHRPNWREVAANKDYTAISTWSLQGSLETGNTESFTYSRHETLVPISPNNFWGKSSVFIFFNDTSNQQRLLRIGIGAYSWAHISVGESFDGITRIPRGAYLSPTRCLTRFGFISVTIPRGFSSDNLCPVCSINLRKKRWWAEIIVQIIVFLLLSSSSWYICKYVLLHSISQSERMFSPK